MSITVDFSNVQDVEFEVLPAGVYSTVISGAQVKQGQNHPYLALELQIQDGDYSGRKVWDNLSFSPNALWKMKKLFSALEMETTGNIEFEPEDLIGEEVAITLRIATDKENRQRNTVHNYLIEEVVF